MGVDFLSIEVVFGATSQARIEVDELRATFITYSPSLNQEWEWFSSLNNDRSYLISRLVLSVRFYCSDEAVFALVKCVVKEAVGVTQPTNTSNHAWLVSLSPQHHRDEVRFRPWLVDLDAGPGTLGITKYIILEELSLICANCFLIALRLRLLNHWCFNHSHSWRIYELRLIPYSKWKMNNINDGKDRFFLWEPCLSFSFFSPVKYACIS